MEVTLLYFFFYVHYCYTSSRSSSGGLDVLLGVCNARVCFWLVVLYCFFLMAHMVEASTVLAAAAAESKVCSFVHHYSRIGRMRAMVVVLPLTTDDQHLVKA